MKLRPDPPWLRDATRDLKRCRTQAEFDAVVAAFKTPARIAIDAIMERRAREDAELAELAEIAEAEGVNGG